MDRARLLHNTPNIDYIGEVHIMFHLRHIHGFNAVRAYEAAKFMEECAAKGRPDHECGDIVNFFHQDVTIEHGD